MGNCRMAMALCSPFVSLPSVAADDKCPSAGKEWSSGKKWTCFRGLLSTFRESSLLFFCPALSRCREGFVSYALHAIAYMHSAVWRFLPSPFTSLLNILILSAEGVKQKDENAALPPSPDKGRNNRQNEKLSANCEQRINPVSP